MSKAERLWNLFTEFAEEWSILRKVYDSRDGSVIGTGAGKATFTKLYDNEVNYREDLEFSYNGDDSQRYKARNEYFYIKSDEGKIKKFTRDKEFMYILEEKCQNSKGMDFCGEYICGSDIYRSFYNIFEDRFNICYEIDSSSSSQDGKYRIFTEYSRNNELSDTLSGDQLY